MYGIYFHNCTFPHESKSYGGIIGFFLPMHGKVYIQAWQNLELPRVRDVDKASMKPKK